MEAHLSQQYPLCKVGNGPNDWDEPSVQIILVWLQKAFAPGKTRSDAIAYISKRNHPDRDEYPTLVARLEEGKAKQSVALKPPADRMAELLRSLQESAEVEVAS